MFSKSCEYAIRAVIFLAEAPDNQLTSLGVIAAEIGSPIAYTAKILQKLSNEKIITSTKGKSGGYHIDKKKTNKILLSHIVDAIDGDTIYTSCALGLKACSNTNPCPLHDKFKIIRNDLKIMLETTSLKNLLDGLNSGKAILK
jgi:Rrf2 family protein